ncbi:putative ribonuclease H-like domain-containing protein [Tanacetum coccineum]
MPTCFAGHTNRFGAMIPQRIPKDTSKAMLAILGENISQEDLNLKFLRSLPSKWNTHVVVWRNQPDLDSMTFNDLYKNFKIVEQEFKRTVTSSSNLGSQNVAFVSTPSSTNEVNTANIQVSTANSTVSTNSTLDSTANLSDATVYAFLANQPNGSQLVHEDLEQIHEDDLGEMDLKWQLALLSIRAMMYYQRTRKKITINGSDTVGYDKSKVQCFNCHKMRHFARECKNPRNQESRPRNQDSSRRTVNVEDPSSKAMVAIDGAGLFSPPTIDLSNSGLKEFQQPEFKGNGFKKNKGVCENSSSKIKGTGDAPIIEDWVSDCDEDESEGIVLKFDNKLGVGFQFTKKACFVCGSFNHLIKDCDFHDKKMVQKPVLNNVNKRTGQREVRPVWNNAMRVNHQNFSNFRRNFVPTTDLTKSGIVPVNAARPINTVAPKSFVNIAKTKPNVFQKSHSLSRRPFYQQTTFKNRNLNDKVNTAKVNSVNTTKVNFVNTTKGNRVKSAVGEQGINVVKSSTCWVWRPKIKADSSLELKVLVVHHTTNGHQFTMSNRQERIGYSKANGNWYALTANPTIYVSLIEQFWQTVTIDTVNDGEQQLTVIVDGQTIAITEASVRRNLQLANADGISSLPNTEIFDQLTLMGYVSNDDKLTFQKGVHIPLYDTMLNHDQPGQGEGPTLTVESQHTPIASPSTSQPTTSQPMSSHEQPSQVPITEPITDSFTTSHPTLTPSPMPHDSPLSGGHTPGSDEGSKKLNELMKLCTKLSIKQLTPTKVTQVEEQCQESFEAHLSVLSAAKILADASRERSDTIKSYQTLKKKPVSVAQAKKNMMIYLKNMAGYKMVYFKGMSYDEIRPLFEVEYNKIQTLFKKDTEVEKTKTKRIAEETLLQESFKKLRTVEASRSKPIQEQPTEEPKELSKEELKKMLEIVLVEETKAEALQVKYPIIDWEIHTEGSRKYWKIIRVRNITKAYKVFEDMLKGFDIEDLVTL